MHRLAVGILSLGLSLTVAATCGARPTRQAKSKTPRRKASRPMRTEIGGSPLVEVRKVGQADISYDTGRRVTVVSLPRQVICTARCEESVDLDASFFVGGKEVGRPDAVKFQIIAHEGHGIPFKAGRGMKLRADGKLYSLTKVVKKRESFVGVPQTVITGELAFSSFEQAVLGERVEFLIGPHAFALQDKQRDALRDLLRATEPVVSK